MDADTFRAVGYPLRLHAGRDALARLPAEVDRQQRRRAFVICGRSVARRTNLIERIADGLGHRLAGVFDAMDKDSSWAAVERATAAARDAGADLLVAVGGGSVIVGTRAVAIVLSEPGDPYALMTQYPDGQPAHSPRLDRPKPPIINVVTTPTTAMNRGGSALRNDRLDHRMEFYDPKTRPVALIWDAEALLSAPPELVRSTATTTFSSALRLLGTQSMNPLVEGDRRQAFRLLRQGLPRIMAEPDNAALRIELCCAAFLDNRAADDDQGRRRTWDRTTASAYALATALHIRYEHVWQGESTSAVMPAVTRAAPPDDPAVAVAVAAALGVWREGMSADAAAQATADALERLYQEVGMPAHLRELGIPPDDLPALARDTLKNFNANSGQRPEEQEAQMLGLLRVAW